jgi:hypothetical protein
MAGEDRIDLAQTARGLGPRAISEAATWGHTPSDLSASPHHGKTVGVNIG